MGLFEDMFIKAKDTANNIGLKAGKIVDVSKLNLELAETKSHLKSKFENIGKILYSSTKNGEFSSDSVENEIKEIDTIYYRIESIKKEIALLKNKIVCKTCGSENSFDALYCNKCGHTLEIKCTCHTEKSEDEDIFKDDLNCGCRDFDAECTCDPECKCTSSSPSEADD